MTTRSDWKRMLDERSIKVWVCEKVARNARGVIIDAVIDRMLTYRDESLRLFEAGNVDASMWAARAMQDSAIEIDCAIEEKTATQAGRKSVNASAEANAKSTALAGTRHADWQARANAIWQQPQHADKSAARVAELIARDNEKPGTIRRAIKKLS